MFEFVQKLKSRLFFKIIFLLVIVFTAFIIISSWQYSISDLCENNLIEEKYAPDNKHKILIFERNCGATTQDSLQVNIVSATTKFTNDSIGNTLVIDSGDKILVNWITNESLGIIYRIDQKVYKKETEVEGIEITYYDNTLLPSPDSIEPGIVFDRDGNPIYEIR